MCVSLCGNLLFMSSYMSGNRQFDDDHNERLHREASEGKRAGDAKKETTHAAKAPAKANREKEAQTAKERAAQKQKEAAAHKANDEAAQKAKKEAEEKTKKEEQQDDAPH